MRSLLLQSANLMQTNGARAAARADEAESHVWATPMTSHSRVDSSYSRTYDQQISAVNVGGDRRVFEGEAGTARLGVSLTQGHSSVDYTRGKGSIDITSLAGHATFKARSGAYITGSIGGSYLHNSYNATNLQGSTSAGKFHMKAAHAGVGAGYSFAMGHQLTLEPSASIIAGVMSGDRDVTSTGVAMETKRTDFGTAKAGVTLRHTGSTGSLSHEVYVRVARLETFGDDLSVTASKNGGSISTDATPGRRAGYEAALGVSVDLNKSKNLSMTLEASRQQLSGSASGWSGLLGIKYRW